MILSLQIVLIVKVEVVQAPHKDNHSQHHAHQ
jgi:hypothetical protein